MAFDIQLTFYLTFQLVNFVDAGKVNNGAVRFPIADIGRYVEHAHGFVDFYHTTEVAFRAGENVSQFLLIHHRHHLAEVKAGVRFLSLGNEQIPGLLVVDCYLPLPIQYTNRLKRVLEHDLHIPQCGSQLRILGYLLNGAAQITGIVN